MALLWPHDTWPPMSSWHKACKALLMCELRAEQPSGPGVCRAGLVLDLLKRMQLVGYSSQAATWNKELM